MDPHQAQSVEAVSETALEARARRAAKRVGLAARKSRCRFHHLNNYGGFMLVDPYRNAVVNGERFELSGEDVIEYCRQVAQAARKKGDLKTSGEKETVN